MTTKTLPENTAEITPVLLLEIGTEEIPARFLPDAIVRLRENAAKLFSEYAIGAESIKTYATPRRLSLIAELHPSQNAVAKKIWGPPVSVAFDSQGNPTKAAEAFARANNISLEDISREEKGKGSYLVALIREEAKQTEALLPELLPRLIMSFQFPKNMRWGNGDFRFARPVHWILALFNNKRVPFEIDGMKSVGMTRGHRFLAPAPFEIKDSKTYVNLLRNNFVILDTEERTKMITEGAKKLAASVNASLIDDEELLQHVVFLVEYPTPVLGAFPEGYLALPKELLTTVMKGHQKYFALESAEGQLVNHFIVISNTTQGNSENVRTGAERVIKARFEDARFYYEEDLRIPLMERLEGLKKVVYHEKLGTLHDKTMRIASMAEFISAQCFKEKKKDINTAALLSKTDLISGAVREFPELQGLMGGYYAAHEGYHKKISGALAEQYLPASSGGRLPETPIGSVLSLSDKFDNVASFFMLGLSPSGSEDPFALRRQANGIIAILIATRCALPVSALLEKALSPFKFSKKKEPVMDNLIRFFEQRVEALFQGDAYPQDAVSSVAGLVKSEPLFIVKEHLEAVMKFKSDETADTFLLALKRINNIVPTKNVPAPDKTLFVQDEEKALFLETEARAAEVASLVKEGRCHEAVKVLQELTGPINTFFDKVLVMDKDERIKGNRLALLKTIQRLALLIADFSRLS